MGKLTSNKIVIREIKTADYLSMAKAGTLDPLVQYNLVDAPDAVLQYKEMPAEDTVGHIVQYVGETNADYINGYFYKFVGGSDNAFEITRTVNCNIHNPRAVFQFFAPLLTMKDPERGYKPGDSLEFELESGGTGRAEIYNLWIYASGEGYVTTNDYPHKGFLKTELEAIGLECIGGEPWEAKIVTVDGNPFGDAQKAWEQVNVQPASGSGGSDIEWFKEFGVTESTPRGDYLRPKFKLKDFPDGTYEFYAYSKGLPYSENYSLPDAPKLWTKRIYRTLFRKQNNQIWGIAWFCGGDFSITGNTDGLSRMTLWNVRQQGTPDTFEPTGEYHFSCTDGDLRSDVAVYASTGTYDNVFGISKIRNVDTNEEIEPYDVVFNPDWSYADDVAVNTWQIARETLVDVRIPQTTNSVAVYKGAGGNALVIAGGVAWWQTGDFFVGRLTLAIEPNNMTFDDLANPQDRLVLEIQTHGTSVPTIKLLEQTGVFAGVKMHAGLIKDNTGTFIVFDDLSNIGDLVPDEDHVLYAIINSYGATRYNWLTVNTTAVSYETPITIPVPIEDATSGGDAGLPDMAGHSGYLTTDGTVATWSDKEPLVNTATDFTGLAITNIGYAKESGAVAIGFAAYAFARSSVAVGHNPQAQLGSVAVGSNAYAMNGSVAIGCNARANEENTFHVGFLDNRNYKLLNTDGLIPSARFANEGEDGQVLVKNGDYAEWKTVEGGELPNNVLVNNNTDETSIGIGGRVPTGTMPPRALAIGVDSVSAERATSIGYNTNSGRSGVAVGFTSGDDREGSVSLGYSAKAGKYGISIGYYAASAIYNPEGMVFFKTTNRVGQLEGSYKNCMVWENPNGIYTLFDADGHIPDDRLPQLGDIQSALTAILGE